MTTRIEYGTRCLYEDTNFFLCPDRSVCILIKTEKFSFSEMLPRELSSVCQVYAETHRNIFNCSKTVSMTFKAKRAKSSHPITDKWVVKIWNMLTTTNIWELYWILSSQMTKTFRDNCDKNICAANKLRAFISRCSNAVKNVIFRSFCTSGVASPKIGGGKSMILG